MSDVIMFEELIKSSPFAVIELFELHLDPVIHGSNTIFRFYSGVVVQTSTAEIIYQGNTYVAIPIEAQGFEYTAGQSGFPRPTLRVGNLFSVVSALMLNVNETTFGNDLTGAKVVRIRTLSRFLDAVNFTGGTNPYGTPSGEQMPQEVYFVNRKIVENRDVVEFELAAKLDLENIKAPKRQCLANVCQWIYRSTECGYTGTNYFDENDNPIGATAAPNFTYSSGDEELANGQSLTAGEFLVSSNGWYRAQFGTKGDFFIFSKAYDPSSVTQVLWRTGTSDRGGTSITMGTNGDFFISTGTETIWQTHTAFKGTPSTVSWNSYIPETATPGRHAAFYHEIFGNADDSADTNVTQQKTFTLADGRSITLEFTASSVLLDPDDEARTLGVERRWENPTSAFTAPATVISSNGLFKKDEVIRVTVDTSASNPYRNQQLLESGIFYTVGAVYTVTATAYSTAKVVLEDDGNLKVVDGGGSILYQTNRRGVGEPLRQTGTANPLDDVCGKRVTSCKKRFGEYGELPFGSFPGVGTNLS